MPQSLNLRKSPATIIDVNILALVLFCFVVWFCCWCLVVLLVFGCVVVVWFCCCCLVLLLVFGFVVGVWLCCWCLTYYNKIRPHYISLYS